MSVLGRPLLVVGLAAAACTLSPTGADGELSGGGAVFGADDDGNAETEAESGDPSDAGDEGGSTGAGPAGDGEDDSDPEPPSVSDDGGGEDGGDDGGAEDGEDDGGDDGREPGVASCPSGALDDALPAVHNGSTLGEADLHEGSCGGSGADLGLGFTAPQAGLYTFSTDGSDFDTVLYVIDGDACNGAELACDDDSGASTQSSLSVTLAAGQDVVVMVDGYEAAADGAFTVQTMVLPSSCGDSSALGASAPTSTQGATAGSSLAGGTCGGGEAPEAIFEWTAPAAGSYRISTDGSDFDTVLHVRDGDCLGVELGCDDDGGQDLQSELVLDLNAGQTIVVFVDGYQDNGGAFTLSIDS